MGVGHLAFLLFWEFPCVAFLPEDRWLVRLVGWLGIRLLFLTFPPVLTDASPPLFIIVLVGSIYDNLGNA